MIPSDAKIASWNWGLSPGNSAFVAGTLALNSGGIAAGKIANLYVSLVDRSGVSRLTELQSIGLSTILTLDSLPPSADHSWDLEFSVSGIPYFSSEYGGSPSINHYVIPVTLKRTLGNVHGINWDATAGEQVDLFGVTYGPSKNTVTMPETVLTTWDASSFTSRNDRWDTREGDVRKEIYKMDPE